MASCLSGRCGGYILPVTACNLDQNSPKDAERHDEDESDGKRRWNTYDENVPCNWSKAQREFWTFKEQNDILSLRNTIQILNTKNNSKISIQNKILSF